MCAECEALRAEVARLKAERLKLDQRIHNQRAALRQNWETVERRASYKALPSGVRSRYLEGWAKAVSMSRSRSGR